MFLSKPHYFLGDESVFQMLVFSDQNQYEQHRKDLEGGPVLDSRYGFDYKLRAVLTSDDKFEAVVRDKQGRALFISHREYDSRMEALGEAFGFLLANTKF